MNDLLDHSITASLAALVDDAPPAGPTPTEHDTHRVAPARHSPWLAIAAAVVVLAGVGGVVAVVTRSDPGPSPTASSVPARQLLPGVFPAGGRNAAIDAGYATPVDAVTAYLASITDPARLPDGFQVTAQVGDPPTVVEIDPDHAVVGIELQTPDDSGDGRVSVQRVRNDPAAWQVTSADVVGDETRDVQLSNGALTGVVAPVAGGTTTLYAYDTTTGEPFAWSTVTTGNGDSSVPTEATFRFDIGDRTDVGLRYWNTVAPAGGYQYANFTDRIITTDPQPTPTNLAPTAPSPATTAPPPTTAQSDLPLAAPGPDDATWFPVLDEAPAGLKITAYVQHLDAEQPWSEALIGQLADDVASNTVAISVRAGPWDINPLPDAPPQPVDVFGQPGALYDYSDPVDGGPAVLHVTWGTGPYFVASGADPLAFLSTADPTAITAAGPATDGQAPVLTLGTLPKPYQVLAAPQQRGGERLAATLAIGDDNFDMSVSTRNYVVTMAQVGTLKRLQFADRVGWRFLSPDRSDITWQIDDHTYAYLKVYDGSDHATASDLAVRTRFVDWTTFTNIYDVEGLVSPTSATMPPD